MDSNSELAIVDWIRQLDIAEGLKELLIEAGFTIDSIGKYSYQEFSDILHIDPYIARLILEEVQNVKEKLVGKEISYYS
ncbi:MAG: hypothetical protein ACRD8W_32145 [Nitrososphaeraceae archaeon]